MAMSHYRESLEIVKQTLLFPNTAPDDSALTGVLLLGIYEVINSTLVDEPQYRHISGLETLADLRGSLLLQGYGPNLLQIVCCQIQRRNLDRKIPPSPADERLVKLLDPCSLANQMIFNITGVAKFVANVTTQIQNGRITHLWKDILQNFNRLENDLLRWELAASPHIGFVEVQHHAAGGNLESPTKCVYHKYLGFWTLNLWNKHRTARIILHENLLEAIDAIRSNSSECALDVVHQEQHAASIPVIEEMTDLIFFSIPFSLGDVPLPPTTNGPQNVGGYFLVWVLQVILRSIFVSDIQRKKANDSLLRIGKQCGISYATISARTFATSSASGFASPRLMIA